MIDIATGLSIDPRWPATPRGDQATERRSQLQANEPSENVASPIWKDRRRPKRSAERSRQHEQCTR